MKKALACMFVVMLFVGCSTTGRFALMDFDAREPSQITAYIPEGEIVYTSDNVSTQTVASASADVEKKSTVSTLIDFFMVATKSRLRLISVEWKK